MLRHELRIPLLRAPPSATIIALHGRRAVVPPRVFQHPPVSAVTGLHVALRGDFVKGRTPSGNEGSMNNRLLGLLSFTLTLGASTLVDPGIALAATTDCTSPDGWCELGNEGGGDFMTCLCADNTYVISDGTDEWGELSAAELQPICESQLSAHCGTPPPPDEIHCAGLIGECIIDSTPEDSLWCECTDGNTDGFVGGSTWAGYSGEALLAECEAELESRCNPLPPPPPPPPVLECTSGLGSCTITAYPIDWIECVCSAGEGFVDAGGNEWAELSEEELLAMCDQELAAGCAIGSETGDSDGGSSTSGETSTDDGAGSSDGAGSGDEAGSTGGEGSTGGGSAGGEGTTGDTGLDGDGGLSEGSSTDAPSPATTGEAATSDASEGGDGDGSGGADHGRGGCSITPRSTSRSLPLALLGLLLAGRRRRRAG